MSLAACYQQRLSALVIIAVAVVISFVRSIFTILMPTIDKIHDLAVSEAEFKLIQLSHGDSWLCKTPAPTRMPRWKLVNSTELLDFSSSDL